MSKATTLELETQQLLDERAYRKLWLRLAGVGIVAKRPKPNRAGRPLVTAPRSHRAPAIRYRYNPGSIVHR